MGMEPNGLREPAGAETERNACISTLQATDWNEEWKRLQRVRRKADDAQYWNKRSRNFDDPASPSPYVVDFIDRLALEPGEAVLDMGCGTGSIGVPLARAGHPVISGDFSESMLAEARRRAERAGLAPEAISPLLIAWDDDWEERGLAPKQVGTAFASRSIATYDLKAALAKLEWIARRRCCITLTCGNSPRTDERVLAACGIRNEFGRDFQYAWNILVNAGRAPEVSYIRSVRRDTFADSQAAFEDMRRMVDEALPPADEARRQAAYANLRAWLAGQLVENEEAGQPDAKGNLQGALRLREPRAITWGFIAWEPGAEPL